VRNDAERDRPVTKATDDIKNIPLGRIVAAMDKIVANVNRQDDPDRDLMFAIKRELRHMSVANIEEFVDCCICWRVDPEKLLERIWYEIN
jgi:hypothetical protein